MPAVATGLSVRDNSKQASIIVGGVVGGVLGLLLIAALICFGCKRFKKCRIQERQQTADPFPYDDGHWRRNLNLVAEVSRPLLPDGNDEAFDPNKRSWTMSTAYSKEEQDLPLPYLPSPAPYLVSPHARGRDVPLTTLPALPSPPFTSRSPKCLPRLVIPSLQSSPAPPPVASLPTRALIPNRPPSVASYEHPAYLQPESIRAPSGHRPRSVVSVASQLYNASVGTPPVGSSFTRRS